MVLNPKSQYVSPDCVRKTSIFRLADKTPNAGFPTIENRGRALCAGRGYAMFATRTRGGLRSSSRELKVWCSIRSEMWWIPEWVLVAFTDVGLRWRITARACRVPVGFEIQIRFLMRAIE